MIYVFSLRALIRRWWRAKFIRRRTPLIRAALIDADAARLARVARAEGVHVDTLDEGLCLLVRTHDVTWAEAVALVERNGLARAGQILMEEL